MSQEHEPWKFRWDYKIAYRDSPYYVRKHRAVVDPTTNVYTNCPVTQEDMDLKVKENPNWRG